MAHPFDAHGGLRSQQFGGSRQAFDRGVVQPVSTIPGKAYLFRGWFMYTFYDGYPDAWPSTAVLRVGWDPTGQTSNPEAATVQWSANLIETHLDETEIWYFYQATFHASGELGSLWLRGHQNESRPAVRISVDDLLLQPFTPSGTVERDAGNVKLY